MANVRKSFRSVFVWSYARGTIQYDIICILILAFIFLVPRSCFVSGYKQRAGTSIQKARIGPSGTIAKKNDTHQ